MAKQQDNGLFIYSNRIEFLQDSGLHTTIYKSHVAEVIETSVGCRVIISSGTVYNLYGCSFNSFVEAMDNG